MITVSVPRFDDSATEFAIKIRHAGCEYVYSATYQVPRNEDGSIDRPKVDQIVWEEYVKVDKTKDEIWPDRVPSPYERSIEETVVPVENIK
jgi:hypothetical protein